MDQLTVAELKALRESRGLTQAGLAELLGVSRRTVEGWEYGRPQSVLAVAALRRLVGDKP